MKRFAEKVAQELNERGFVAETVEVTKNNCILTGITVRENADEKVGVTLYIDGIDGDEFEVADEVEKRYENSKATRPEIGDFTSNYTDWEWIKPRLATKVVNTSNAESFARQGIVFRHALDLLIVPYVLIGTDINGAMTVTVREEHAKLWGVEIDELIDLAMENNKNVDAPLVQDMFDVMLEMMGDIDEEMLELMGNTRGQMIVVTSQSKMNGAKYIFDMELMREIADKNFGGRMLIIPSSIHEVICVPMSDTEDITGIIGDVNAENVDIQEQLGNRPYIFEDGTLR